MEDLRRRKPDQEAVSSEAGNPGERSLGIPRLSPWGGGQSPAILLQSSCNARHQGVGATAGFQGPAEASVGALASGSAMPGVVSGCCVPWPSLLPYHLRLPWRSISAA